MTDMPSNGPIVEQFREILLWPLELKLPHDLEEKSSVGNANWLTRLQQELRSGHWFPVRSPYEWDKNADPVTRYAEFVYFHPFVQRFLYNPKKNGQPSDKPPMSVFRREDIKQLHFEFIKRAFDDSDKAYLELDETFDVERLLLFVFDIRVVVLTVEIVARRALPLAHVQEILDSLRRVYPPYWEETKQSKTGQAYIVPGHCPVRVSWLRENGSRLATSDYTDRVFFRTHVEQHHTPPIAGHWMEVLEPLNQKYKDNGKRNRFEIKQLNDERIPFMAYCAMSNPDHVTRGDFMRLCFADDSGNPERLPYSPDFLENFEDEYCYDRYWQRCSEPPRDWLNTRYMACGYGFVLIGQHSKDRKAFFCDDQVGALAHFRHHYFLMGLIAHFHKATLLMLSDELSLITRDIPDMLEQGFMRKVRRVNQSLLYFTHRFWFPELSNQVQARELFDLWSKHLGTRELFRQVKEEVREINHYTDMLEQQSQTQTSVRLTVVATVGLAFALATGFLGMNVLIEKPSRFLLESLIVIGAFVFFTLLMFLIVFISDFLNKFFKCLSDKGIQWFKNRSDKNKIGL